MTLVAVHDVEAGHLEAVEREMQRLGAPTVRAIEVAGVLYAVEGTHRLAAAAKLGLTPVVEIVAGGEADDDLAVTIAGCDLDDRETWHLGELRAYLSEMPIDARRAIYSDYEVA